MNKYFIVGFLTISTTAMAGDLENFKATPSKVKNIIGFELAGRGETSKFFDVILSDGANAMLHGYVPRTGDVVEFYVRDAHCDQPDKECNFELAIRKRSQ